jgi:ABC-type multidrug transport system ATPase subunit
VDELVKIVKLEKHRHFEAMNLSGGMRRRLSIALALASPSESSIVILDEPTTGLDAMVREEVWQLIRSLKTGRCIVMTTQHLQEAEELAD